MRLTFLLFAQGLCCFWSSSSNPPPQFDCNEATCNLTLHDGTRFVGAEQNGVVQFRGIPYAEPPVGNLRFKQVNISDLLYSLPLNLKRTFLNQRARFL